MGFLSNLLGNAGVATVDELSKEFGNLLTNNEAIEIGLQLRLPVGTLRFGSLKFIYAKVRQGPTLLRRNNLPDPDELALDIVENLEAGLESFKAIIQSLNKK